jgi:pyruvate dehydrogenase E2 component (dihydrolipoamide acetyltransferase)
VVDEKIVPRTVVNISLAADHRVTDGQMGARFLNDIQKLLQKPHKLEGGL